MKRERSGGRGGIALGTASLLLLFSAACAKKADDVGASAAASSSSAPALKPSASAAPTAALSPSTSPSASAGAQSLDALFGALAVELKNRPDVHPNVDDAFAAIAKGGVTVPKPNQSMAKTYKASYCSHGVTTAGDLSILFCEYADAEKLAAGVIESNKLFPGLTTRRTYANKQLLMVITHQDAANAPSTKVEEQKALAIFRAL